MCSHPINASPARKEELLQTVLKPVDSTEEGTWYVDVGLEIMLEGQALLWTTQGHGKILSDFLDIPITKAEAIIANHYCYARDVSTHLTAISGFRCHFANHKDGEGVGRLFCAYAQGYMSNKCQTYHPKLGRYGKTLTVQMAVNGNPPRFLQGLSTVNRDAGRRVDVAGRFEGCFPLVVVLEALQRASAQIVERCMVCYRRKIWW